MLIYSIATLLSIFFSWKYMRYDCLDAGSVSDDVARRKAYAVLSFLPLYVVSALRWNTGTDTFHTYTPEYYGMILKMNGHLTGIQQHRLLQSYNLLKNTTKSMKDIGSVQEYFATQSAHTSPLFQGMEKILIHMNADVQWLYVITSAIILALVFAAIYRQSVSAPLSILFFVITSNYFLTLNVIAQYIAIALCLVSCEFVQKRKSIPFLLLVAIAAGFHTSALVFLPVYLLPRLKIRPRWCSSAVTICFIVSPILVPALQKAVYLFAPKYARYFGEKPSFELVFFGIGVFVLLLSSYYYEKCKEMSYFRIWYYMNVLGLLALCFSGQVPYMKRINYYYSAPVFLLFPLLIKAEEDEKKQRLLKWGLIVLFLLETVVAVCLMNKNQVMPYTACWQRHLGIVVNAPLI